MPLNNIYFFHSPEFLNNSLYSYPSLSYTASNRINSGLVGKYGNLASCSGFPCNIFNHNTSLCNFGNFPFQKPFQKPCTCSGNNDFISFESASNFGDIHCQSLV